MRRLAALALVLFLLSAAPAAAQITGDDMGSEAQTQGYGKIFGFVCAAVAGLVIILTIVHVIRGMVDETQKGKKTGISIMNETILDDDKQPKKKRALYLGEKVPDWKVNNRIDATAAALTFLAKADDWFDPEYLAKITRGAVTAVKEAVEVKALKKVGERLTPECLEDLRAEVARLKKKGERHVYGTVEVVDIEIVHVEAPANAAKHTFTALVSAKSKDYIQDEKTKEVLKGDKKLYAYQEFWRFKRTKARWLVERIRPAGDMDRVLEPKNLLAPPDLAKFTKKAEEGHLREFVLPEA